MGKVNVVIVDATGNKEQKVGLPDDIKCGIIMVKLVEKIKLPSVGPDGNPISYKFIHKVTGRQLLEAQTLSEAGIKDGDVLRLQPEITAGAICPKCGTPALEGAAFCNKCGMAVSKISALTYAPVKEKSAVGKLVGRLVISILGMLTGVGCMIYSFSYVPYWYGLPKDLSDIIKEAFGAGLFVFGLVTVLYFALKLFEDRK